MQNFDYILNNKIINILMKLSKQKQAIIKKKQKKNEGKHKKSPSNAKFTKFPETSHANSII